MKTNKRTLRPVVQIKRFVLFSVESFNLSHDLWAESTYGLLIVIPRKKGSFRRHINKYCSACTANKFVQNSEIIRKTKATKVSDETCRIFLQNWTSKSLVICHLDWPLFILTIKDPAFNSEQ